MFFAVDVNLMHAQSSGASCPSGPGAHRVPQARPQALRAYTTSAGRGATRLR
jgi:hypothetical protein